VTGHSIQLALQLAQMPRLAMELRHRPPPEDVLDLIKVAAGCHDTCRKLEKLTGRRPDVVRAAAIHYLHLALLFPGASSASILGLRGSETREIMLRHKHWLIKWLHPDLNQQGWESAQLTRVLAAWQDVTSAPSRSEGRPFDFLNEKRVTRSSTGRRQSRLQIAAPTARTRATPQSEHRSKASRSIGIAVTVASALAITGIGALLATLQEDASDVRVLDPGTWRMSVAPRPTIGEANSDCVRESLAVCSNEVVEQ
jgi:hypothetical protein